MKNAWQRRHPGSTGLGCKNCHRVFFSFAASSSLRANKVEAPSTTLVSCLSLLYWAPRCGAQSSEISQREFSGSSALCVCRIIYWPCSNSTKEAAAVTTKNLPQNQVWRVIWEISLFFTSCELSKCEHQVVEPKQVSFESRVKKNCW